MDRRTFVVIAGAALLPLSQTLRAQGQATRRRIGYLSASARIDVEFFLNLLRPELDKLGWTDGRNVVVLEPRTAEARNERMPSLAAELVAQSPDVILAQGVTATRAVMQATKSIPIVMVGVGNPVELGLVTEYRNPGGNVTGSCFLAHETGRKLLQLLKEAAPRVRSVAIFDNPTNELAATFLKGMQANSVALGMRPQVLEISGSGDFEPAFAAIRRENTESIIITPEPLIRSKGEVIAEFAQRHGLPLVAIGGRRVLPTTGLMSYGPTSAQYAEITARYIDRILKGAKPGDLPVEQPARFELVINMKAAKALGLTIPQSLLSRADEVIQ